MDWKKELGDIGTGWLDKDSPDETDDIGPKHLLEHLINDFGTPNEPKMLVACWVTTSGQFGVGFAGEEMNNFSAKGMLDVAIEEVMNNLYGIDNG